MRITIQGKQIDVPDALAESIQDRLTELSGRYEFLEEAHVVLGRQRNWHTTEVTLHIKHQIIRAEDRSDNVGASIDEVLDKLERQLHRHKGRLLHRSRAGDVREAPPLTSYEPEAEEEQFELPRVVRVKRISVKPMSIEEAALQMELLGHDFYVFTNDETNDMNVVYRRRNGDIGLIQPE
ncbi:MAG: ribosome-associated translation inhibitor RaiA [Armatimonadetes bacterium]|nr:ribosome-associated translation inhibitor RaiA [Armatimonadota bacterium]